LEIPAPPGYRGAVVRLLWIAAGTVFLAVGVAGVVLPLMPGTVFLLLASLCYLRGSRRLHDWLVGHPVLGHHVKVMTGEVAMPRRAKVVAIGSMWAAVTLSVVLAARSLPLQVLLVALAAYGTWFIVVRR
jgi:uncharacterized membrane protein YbaN (DUF454 family)